MLTTLMLAFWLVLATFISTMLGGFTALRHRDSLHRILGYTAGVLLGVVAFDILPEIFDQVSKQGLSATIPMVALVAAFLAFHFFEKSILLHHSHEAEYADHKHPKVGVLSALALTGHSFLDGAAIGLGFQVNQSVGIAVAIAVIAHDFSDGLNTVSLVLTHKNNEQRARWLLAADALAPVAGFLVSRLFQLSGLGLVIYLGVFAGFLLYIGASDILPEAHAKHSSRLTMLLTLGGAVFMFVVTRLI